MAVHIRSKGMTSLMGHDLHIVLGTIKVGKDKGNLVIGNAGAVAAAAL